MVFPEAPSTLLPEPGAHPTPAPVSSSAEGARNHGAKKNAGKGSEQVEPGPAAGRQVVGDRSGDFFARSRFLGLNVAGAGACAALEAQGDAEEAPAQGWSFGGLLRGWRSGGRVDAASPTAALVTVVAGAAQTRKIGGYFFLYYAFNVLYNIFRWQSPCPAVTFLLELFIGAALVTSAWLTRVLRRPKLTLGVVRVALPLAALHVLSHIVAVAATLGDDPAEALLMTLTEPFVVAALSAVLFRGVLRWKAYAALVVAMSGITVTFMTELELSWVAVVLAVLGNTTSAIRTIFSKKAMVGPRGEKMTAVDLYSVVIILSFFLMIPVAMLLEGPDLVDPLIEAIGTGESFVGFGDDLDEDEDFWINITLAGMCFYLYNTMAFLALNAVHPVSYSVGTTMDRVARVVLSGVVFEAPAIDLTVGSSVAILGTVLYSRVMRCRPEIKTE